jgi:hypothetical protein
MIYKNLHQIWLQGPPPDRFEDNINSLKQYHDQWRYMLWDEQSILNLLQEHYPGKYIDMWRSYPTLIQKCDAARHFILHTYGGLYVDLDIYFIRNIDDLITERCVLFYANPIDSINHTAPGKLLTNSIYYAERQDKFMDICIKSLFLNKDKFNDDPNPGFVSFHTTAGGFITKMYEWYKSMVNVTVHGHEHFELKQATERCYNLINCDEVVNTCAGVHMSVGDWFND